MRGAVLQVAAARLRAARVRAAGLQGCRLEGCMLGCKASCKAAGLQGCMLQGYRLRAAGCEGARVGLGCAPLETAVRLCFDVSKLAHIRRLGLRVCEIV